MSTGLVNDHNVGAIVHGPALPHGLLLWLTTGAWLAPSVHDATAYRGKGYSQSEFGRVHWKQGDVFALPTTPEYVRHFADKDSTEHGGPALFWVSDEPLLKYLGVLPSELKFDPTYFDSEVSLTPHTLTRR